MKLQAMSFSNFANLVGVFYRQTLSTTTAGRTSKKVFQVRETNTTIASDREEHEQ
jgi:hypothetical protein